MQGGRKEEKSELALPEFHFWFYHLVAVCLWAHDEAAKEQYSLPSLTTFPTLRMEQKRQSRPCVPSEVKQHKLWLA